MDAREPWSAAFDDLRLEMLALQQRAIGIDWTIAALAISLIDKGTINRGTLLDVIETLRKQLRTLSYDAVGEVQDTEMALDSLSFWITDSELRAGGVLERLHTLETTAYYELFGRPGANKFW